VEGPLVPFVMVMPRQPTHANMSIARCRPVREDCGVNVFAALILAVTVSHVTFGQAAGGGAGQGRVGGISYVTRRMPMSVAGAQAGALLGAGGVSGLATGTAPGGATVAVTAAVGAAPAARASAADGRPLAALRQLAATGDRNAQRLLRSPAVVAQLSRVK
jgi:hypothetical protein